MSPNPAIAHGKRPQRGDAVAVVVARLWPRPRTPAEQVTFDYELRLRYDSGKAQAIGRGANPLIARATRSPVGNLCDPKAAELAFRPPSHVTMIDLINNRPGAEAIATRAAIAEYDCGHVQPTLWNTTQTRMGAAGIAAFAALAPEQQAWSGDCARRSCVRLLLEYSHLSG